MNPSFHLIDFETQKIVKDESGNADCFTGGVPRQGDLVSFGRRAWKVCEVQFVHNRPIRVIAIPIPRPDVANQSYK